MFSTKAGKIILGLHAFAERERNGRASRLFSALVIFMMRIGLMLFALAAGVLALLALPDMDESRGSALALPVTQPDR